MCIRLAGPRLFSFCVGSCLVHSSSRRTNSLRKPSSGFLALALQLVLTPPRPAQTESCIPPSSILLLDHSISNILSYLALHGLPFFTPRAAVLADHHIYFYQDGAATGRDQILNAATSRNTLEGIDRLGHQTRGTVGLKQFAQLRDPIEIGRAHV